MSFYFMTPYGRYINRRRMLDQMAQEENTVQSGRVLFPVDLKAGDDGYTLTALLPGVTSDDLNIQVVRDTITISGELKNERSENDNYILMERPSGRFNKVIRLPEEVQADKADAALKDGVLTLFIPKAEEARPKTIKITAK
jgi:HSP20 family protein